MRMFSYRLMKNYIQSLTLKFVNSIREKHIKTKGVLLISEFLNETITWW